MKKIIKFICVILCLMLSLGVVACGEKEPESDGKVAMDTSLFNEYAHENVFNITPTKDGLKMMGNENLRAACSKMRFPIEENQKISVTFAVPVYEEDSENNLVTGVNMHTKTCVDVMVLGQSLTKPVAQLRLWAEKTVGAQWVNTRIVTGVNGESQAYDGSFEKSGRNYVDAKKVTGNMRMSTPFTIVFDTENFFQSYVDGDKTQIVPLIDKDGSDKEKAVYNDLVEVFNGVKSVSLVFRFSGWTYQDLQDKGYTGFESSSCIYFQEINGQSLLSSDGRVFDTTKPYISAPNIAPAMQLSAYSDYLYEVMSNESNTPGNNTVLYSSFAMDILTWKDLTYSVIIANPDGETQTFNGLNFSIGKAGVYKVKIAVKDTTGNEYVSPEREFTVKDTYRINLSGSIPSTAKKGDTITLPTAFVTNAEGGRTDANGNEYTYQISVLSPIAMEVDIVNGQITLKSKGTYTVTYSSLSQDGSDSKEFKIVVS